MLFPLGQKPHTHLQLLLPIPHHLKGPDSFARDLHKEVVAGIDEAMARHAQETDKVDLLALKKLKGRVNVLEQQIVTDKAKQLTVSYSPALSPRIVAETFAAVTWPMAVTVMALG